MNILKVEILHRQTPRFGRDRPTEQVKETVTVFLRGEPEDFRYVVVVSKWSSASKIKEDTLFFHEVALADHRFEQEVLSKLLEGYNFVEDGADLDINLAEIAASPITKLQSATSTEHRKLAI
jgi:hypothetical protein